MNQFSPSQLDYMTRVLSLARRGTGRVSPNPLVGALIVRGDQVVGQGYHLFESRDHAEVRALLQAGEQAAGADLFVNLEPCCHQGRTPPCTEKIISAGIRRVFVAVQDPNPKVAGEGIAQLRESGVEVRIGLLEQEASRLNEKFFHFATTATPYTLLKLALTLDGKIATRSGQSQWITGERARQYSQRLRFEYDAIAVGVETVLRDDPSLDVRWQQRSSITKVVLDSSLRTPPDARLFDSGDRVVIFHASEVDREKASKLTNQATLVEVPQAPGPRSQALDWPSILADLGGRKITSLIVEGGSRVAASALKAGVVQKINFLYAPKILGGRELSGVADLGIDQLADSICVSDLRTRSLPPDFLVSGYL